MSYSHVDEAWKDAGSGGLDAHPLVREWFGERLAASRPAAWKAGHERLYEHYRQAAPERPETLEAMLPLYAAVVHGCRAGRVQQALDEVYKRRILRGADHFSWHKLGAFGAELTALAGFFERPWDRPDPRLRAADQAWILHEAGFVLRTSPTSSSNGPASRSPAASATPPAVTSSGRGSS